MIRINLIGGKVKRKKTAGGSQLLIYLLVIVSVFVGLFLFKQQQTDQLEAARRRAIEQTEKVDGLKRVQTAWQQWQADKAATDAQTAVFEALQADQVGPSMALQYLSYALRKLPDEPQYQEEAKAQELAGWNPKWDTRRVWLKSIEIRNSTERSGSRIEIKGEALDHEDVAEFYRRLEASDIFIGLESPSQRRKVHDELNIKYVDFSVGANVSFVATSNAWKMASEDALEAASKPAEAQGEAGAAEVVKTAAAVPAAEGVTK